MFAVQILCGRINTVLDGYAGPYDSWVEAFLFKEQFKITESLRPDGYPDSFYNSAGSIVECGSDFDGKFYDW